MEPCTSSTSSQQYTVPFVQSDSANSDSDEVPTKKKRSTNKTWVLAERFSNSKDAEEALREEDTWSLLYTHATEEGKKQYYRCNKVKRRGPQCAAQVHLLFSSTSDAVFMYRTETHHDHEAKNSTSNYGLSQTVKTEISRLFELNLKPKAIMENLSKTRGINLPRMSQLRNFLSDLRRVKRENPTISLGELELWLRSHSAMPEDPHKVFAIAHETSENGFRFVLSTKYLLELARDIEILHADTTYRLTWQGFPVLIVGTSDKNRKFHALCLAVATTEQKDDFKMIFDALKTNVHTLNSTILNPKVLVCDAANSIQSAFTEVFGEEATVRMCWEHAKRKMQARVESSINKDAQREALEDIDTLHSITCPEIFEAAAEAFLQKYKGHHEFSEYFREQWLVQNKNWFLGAASMSPSTNDALESFVRSIKDSNALRERFPLSRFLVVAMEIVSQWSNKYITNTAEGFSRTPTITLEEWMKAYQWAKMPKEMVTLKSDDIYTYYKVPTGKANDLKRFDSQWETFDEFKEQYFSCWNVALPLDKEQWKLGKCNCPMFYNMYICKHVIGLSIRLKYVAPPLEAKNISTEEKGKRGRPSRNKRALIIQ